MSDRTFKAGIFTCELGDHGCTEVCSDCGSCGDCCDCETEETND